VLPLALGLPWQRFADFLDGIVAGAEAGGLGPVQITAAVGAWSQRLAEGWGTSPSAVHQSSCRGRWLSQEADAIEVDAFSCLIWLKFFKKQEL